MTSAGHSRLIAFVFVAVVERIPELCQEHCILLRHGFREGREPAISELRFGMIWRTLARDEPGARRQLSEAIHSLGLGDTIVFHRISDDYEQLQPSQKNAFAPLGDGDVSYETVGCLGFKYGEPEAERVAVKTLTGLIL